MKKEFLDKYAAFAFASEKKTGVSALFILAQAALESGWGKSAPGNAFFGVKAAKDAPSNQKQLLLTTEYLSVPNAPFPEVLSVEKCPNGLYKYRVRDWFKTYDSAEDCFTEHALFFERNKRYAKALLVKNNPYMMAQEVAKAGYATAPNYALTLQGVIKQIQALL